MFTIWGVCRFIVSTFQSSEEPISIHLHVSSSSEEEYCDENDENDYYNYYS